MLNVFVPYIPLESPANRDSLAESWYPFVNAFNTWMDQAQSVKKLAERLYCVRFGMLVTLTGTIEQNQSIDVIPPIESFKVGDVLFSKKGFIINNGDDASISVTYVAKE